MNATTAAGIGHETVTFGIVTALEKEFVAVRAMLDDPSDKVTPKGRVYCEGTIPAKGTGVHRVALVLSMQGTVAVATSATLLTEDYGEVDAVLMVGIAGAVPDVTNVERHVRLGDIVVSGDGGVVAYDFGKQLRSGFIVRKAARAPHYGLYQASRRLKAAELGGMRPWLKHMVRARELPESSRPPDDTDWLADSNDPKLRLNHPLDPHRRNGEPRIFLGTIACANRVLKDPIHRDSLRDQFDVRAVEMEGFGIAEATWHQDVSYLVVRGTCDYCDDNKGNVWQPYAAIAAAGYARALLEELPVSATAHSRAIMREVRPPQIPADALRRLARSLLEAGSPPSVRALFPQSNPKAHDALSNLETSSRTFTAPDGGARVTTLGELAVHKALHHAIESPPGSGKTFALWHGARKLLAEGPLVPLYLPVGRARSWDAVTSGLANLAGGYDPIALLQDPRVCVVLDGWSEFVSNAGVDASDPWGSLLGTRVVASRRRGYIGDSRFCVWNLEPLSSSTVDQAVRTAGLSGPPPPVAELLRLPLALSLYVLLGGTAVTRGELLARLHDHLSQNLPGAFRGILAGAVASVDLATPARSQVLLAEGLQRRCDSSAMSEPLDLVNRLGTLDLRTNTVVPIHDLYWSWLSGLGILTDDRLKDALPVLRTREGLELALEGGFDPGGESIDQVQAVDAPLAAQMLSHQSTKAAAPRVRQAVSDLLADDRIAVRSRGALAGLLCHDERLLRPALDGWTAVRAYGVYDSAFETALDLPSLFRQRGALSDWMGSVGTDLVVDVIAARGESEWSSWLEQLANSEKLPLPTAIGAALACTGRIPEWTAPHLKEAIFKEPYRLRQTALRGRNLELASWIADNCESLTEERTFAVYHLTGVLVSCGSDVVFTKLLDRFGTLTVRAQEFLGLAIAKLGEPWIGRFQEKAFAAGVRSEHHQLLDLVSGETSDETARGWIMRGPETLGWRVLIARHGNGVLGELLEHLPDSFEGLHVIPALEALRHLPDPPDSLADDLWARVRGTMTARATQDLLFALAPIRTRGIPSVIARLARSPDFLPSFHLIQFVGLYQKWKAATGLSFQVRNGSEDVEFIEWLLLKRLPGHSSDPFFGTELGRIAEILVPILLEHFEDDEDEYLQFIVAAQQVPRFHARVVERMLGRSDYAPLIPKVFANAFDTFPDAVLVRVLESPAVDFGAFIRALSQSPTPMHRNVHSRTISRLLERAFDIFEYRSVAQALRNYPRWTLQQVLKEVLHGVGDRELLLIREVEKASGELLVDESGKWLA